MRRGLLQDLANTPAQMACGYRLHSDLTSLRSLAGSALEVDLMHGTVTVDGADSDRQLWTGDAAAEWLHERIARDALSPGLIETATLTLEPRVSERGDLTVACRTTLVAASRSYTSTGTARWGATDVDP